MPGWLNYSFLCSEMQKISQKKDGSLEGFTGTNVQCVIHRGMNTGYFISTSI